MKLEELKVELLEANSSDLSELQPKIIDDLEKNIRVGAKDLTKKWLNALELVHYAYDTGYEGTTLDPEGKKQKVQHPIQRPTPQMKGGWEQYETLIKYAVEQLAKNRGIKGDWRSSVGGK